MKRVVIVFLSVFVLVCLCSCLTLFDDFSDRNSYSSNSYSSKYSKEPLSKEGTIVVYGNFKNFNFQRPIEEEVKSLLERQGFKVEIMSDYHYSDDDFYSVLFSLNPKYLIEVSPVENSLYTYEYGGGISSMGFETLVYDGDNFDVIMKITTSVYGTNNNYEKLVSTQQTVSMKVSKEIVSEFCSYF